MAHSLLPSLLILALVGVWFTHAFSVPLFEEEQENDDVVDDSEFSPLITREKRNIHFGRYGQNNIGNRRPIAHHHRYQQPYQPQPNRRISPQVPSKPAARPHYADEVDHNGYAAILG